MGRLSILAILVISPLLYSSCSSEKKSSQEADRYYYALDLRPDSELIRQYRHVHSPEGMWPEIPEGIKAAGCLDMEIYLTGNRMVMIVDIPKGADIDEVFSKMGRMDRQDEWAEFVWQFQQALPHAKEGEKWMLMEKVYDLDDYN